MQGMINSFIHLFLFVRLQKILEKQLKVFLELIDFRFVKGEKNRNLTIKFFIVVQTNRFTMGGELE